MNYGSQKRESCQIYRQSLRNPVAEVFTSFFFFLAIYQGTVLQTYVTKQLKPLLDLRYFWGEHLITLL